MSDPVAPPAPATPDPKSTAAAATPATTPPAKDAAAEPTTILTAPVVPEKYDLKLPKDSPLRPDALDKVSSFAKERKLTQEQAQALLEGEHAAVVDTLASQQAEYKKQVEAWAGEVKAKYGDKLPEEMIHAKRFLDKYASAKLRQTLNDTGLGNNPDLVEMCIKAGRATKEDSLVIPGSVAGSKRAPEEILYGGEKGK